jgi:thiamine pyrophosphate-dependent acetolactate synthase large subunit-like protein
MVGAGNGLDHRVVFEAINELAPPGTLFVTDVGQHQMWAAQHLRLEGAAVDEYAAAIAAHTPFRRGTP